mgnify:CR=1 FL=1
MRFSRALVAGLVCSAFAATVSASPVTTQGSGVGKHGDVTVAVTFDGGKIKDIMTGYRAFSYQFVKTYPVLSRGFEIETEMTIHALQRNMQVENVVIDYRDRPEGSESKLNTYSDGFKVLGTIARLFKNYRPFSFFGILAAILAVFGIGFMIPVLGEYFRTGLVPRFPTLIVCCFVLVAALLLFISGIILSSQLAKDARDFEFQLQTVQHWRNSAEKEN